MWLCYRFWKRGIPDIEVMIDELCRHIAFELKRQNRYTEERFIENIKAGLNIAILHELIHEIGDIQNETAVDIVTNELLKRLKRMGWFWIPCAKHKRNVTWEECLKCTDSEKLPSCPLRNVRIDAYPRQYKIGRYHVTELMYPLHSYYQRTNPYAADWNEYWDLLYGKALGWYIENLHAKHVIEVEVNETLTRNGDSIEIVGHADLIGESSDTLIEIKFYYSLYHIQKSKKAHEAHEFQARAYYRMGLRSKPWLFDKIKKITVLYYSKTKSSKIPRRLEIDVPLVPLGDIMEKNAWTLHTALVSNKPPLKYRCPEWKCKMCKHLVCPYHPKRGINRNDNTV